MTTAGNITVICKHHNKTHNGFFFLFLQFFTYFTMYCMQDIYYYRKYWSYIQQIFFKYFDWCNIISFLYKELAEVPVLFPEYT
jgi:hypothetical protein